MVRKASSAPARRFALSERRNEITCIGRFGCADAREAGEHGFAHARVVFIAKRGSQRRGRARQIRRRTRRRPTLFGAPARQIAQARTRRRQPGGGLPPGLRMSGMSGTMVRRRDAIFGNGTTQVAPSAAHQFARHSPDHRRLFGFRDGVATASAKFRHGFRAIVSHAGHQDADELACGMFSMAERTSRSVLGCQG